MPGERLRRTLRGRRSCWTRSVGRWERRCGSMSGEAPPYTTDRVGQFFASERSTSGDVEAIAEQRRRSVGAVEAQVGADLTHPGQQLEQVPGDRDLGDRRAGLAAGYQPARGADREVARDRVGGVDAEQLGHVQTGAELAQERRAIEA